MLSDDDREPSGRFPKGTSGNPKGRPRKDRTVSAAILKAAKETITANDNGRRRRIRKVDAAAKQFANKAASGDIRAGKIFIDYAARAEAESAGKGEIDIPLSQTDAEIVAAFLAEHRRYLGEDRQ